MAKYTRGAVRIAWLRKPRVEMAMPRAIQVAPVCPKVRRMTAVAGTRVLASSAAPNARKQTKFTLT